MYPQKVCCIDRHEFCPPPPPAIIGVNLPQKGIWPGQNRQSHIVTEASIQPTVVWSTYLSRHERIVPVDLEDKKLVLCLELPILRLFLSVPSHMFLAVMSTFLLNNMDSIISVHISEAHHHYRCKSLQYNSVAKSLQPQFYTNSEKISLLASYPYNRV